jgi:hypothetical protein
MADIEIITVDGGASLRDFIDLPWKIYAQYSNWVPPLRKRLAGCWTPLDILSGSFPMELNKY